MLLSEISLDRRYKLKKGVRVRGESFGALLYDSVRETLYFVRPPASLPLLKGLIGGSTLRDIVHAQYGDPTCEAPIMAIVGQLAEWGVIDEI